MRNELKKVKIQYKKDEKLTQEQVWDKISESWKYEKTEPFPDVKPFLEKLSKSESKPKNNEKKKILEIGCGNCRNLLLFKNKNFELFGADFAGKQLNQARIFCNEKKINIKLKKARAENLPFKENYFDYILSIAVVHCIKGQEKREKAIKEIYRVLKQGGKALITVWNKTKDKEFIKKGKEQFVPWTKTEKPYLRYYYFFTSKEFENLLKKFNFKILQKKIDKNIIFLVEKT